MKYTMTSPCEHCPFRNDVHPYLSRLRATEIADSITRQQQTFPCHETTVESDDADEDLVETKDSQHCAGALIMLEKLEQPNQMMRIAERLGMYDRTKLKMDSPVFDSTNKFIAHHAKSDRASRKRKAVSP